MLKKILHPFRRNRSYHPRERWLTVGAMLALTVVISSSSWLFFGRPAASATSLTVSQIDLGSHTLSAGLDSGTTAEILLVDKTTGAPASGVWVGLYIKNSWQRTPQLTHNDWYSPDGNRTFYQTDNSGRVNFTVMSDLAGDIKYDIYAANPELKNDNKYQALSSSFTLNFE